MRFLADAGFGACTHKRLMVGGRPSFWGRSICVVDPSQEIRIDGSQNIIMSPFESSALECDRAVRECMFSSCGIPSAECTVVGGMVEPPSP